MLQPVGDLTDDGPAFGATTAEVEGAKLVHDTLRQLTTLSSGSILIMATLLDRVISQPAQRWLVALSFGAFVVCLVCAGMGMGAVSGLLSGRRFAALAPRRLRSFAGRRYDQSGGPLFGSIIAAWVSFVIGMAALGLFALLNFA
jgi:hypothetical protein